MSKYFLDIEANGLLEEADTIWTIYTKDVDTGEWDRYIFDTDPTPMMKKLLSADELICHNLNGYDLPLLKKLWELDYQGKTTDTLVMSKLWYPDLPSPKVWQGRHRPHSLEAWGVRLGGEQKVVQEQWTVFEPNMLERCKVDVQLTERVYNYLMRKMEL